MSRAVRRDGGSVSVVLAAAILLVLVLTMGTADLGRVLVARSHARMAADAAALAAAYELALPSGGDPTALAADYAARNGAELTSCVCAIGTFDALVEVRVASADLMLFPGPLAVEQRARAMVDLPAG